MRRKLLNVLFKCINVNINQFLFPGTRALMNTSGSHVTRGNIKDIPRTALNMVMDHSSKKMEVVMTGNGATTRNMVLESKSGLTLTKSMRVIGKMGNNVVIVHVSSLPLGRYIMVNGIMIRDMDGG